MAGGYSVPADGDFGVLVQRLSDLDNRLRELERPTGSQTQKTLTTLSNRAVLALGNSGTLTVPVPTGDKTTIVWDAATSPQIAFTTPYSLALVSVGCFATANGINTSDVVYAFMGLSINGVTPGTGFGEWPYVDSRNPTAGSSFSRPLVYTSLISVTPNLSTTVNPRYGYGRVGGVAGATDVTFSGRYTTITPIPN